LPSPAYTQQLTRSRDIRYRNEPNNYSGAGSIEKANVIYKQWCCCSVPYNFAASRTFHIETDPVTPYYRWILGFI
jgi:hypothetical protein